MEELTEQEIKEWEEWIDNMTHMGMAQLQRFASSGHPVFRNDLPLYARFQARFESLGGMTPKISKAIGW